MDFKGKVVIVTGAASGIGAAAASRFAKLSGQVALVDKDEEKLKTTLATCENQSNNKHLAIVADLSKHEDLLTVISKTIKYFGKIDVLVNAAGILTAENVLEDDFTKNYNAIMSINLKAPIVLINKAAPYLVDTKGNIVNVTSVASSRPNGDKPLYCVSKAGLEMFTKCIALKLAPKGVRVNSVNPGVVRTNIRLSVNPATNLEEHYKNVEKIMPFGVIETEEVAKVITFLAGEDGRSVTGSSYYIDGGISVNVTAER